LLQKTMVVVEGVARGLDPKLDMWSTAEPVVSEWVLRHLGPAGRIEDAAGGVVEFGRFLANVPEILGRVARLMDQLDVATRDGIVLAPDTLEKIAFAEARKDRATALAMVVIAALVALVTLAIWMR
jgi:ubiquinone biosynthesis protein